MNKAIFFDRDGVINKRILGGYVRSWDEFEIDPDFSNVLREVKKLGYLAIVITNQRGVGRGLMTQDDLDHIHSQLQLHLAKEVEHQFDDIIACTDMDDSSARRKPSPAMLLEAAHKHNIDLKQSWMVGDSPSDIAAGKAAGTRTAYLLTEHSREGVEADVVLNSIGELLNSVSLSEQP
jgi:D-glycero-D-manno-heptose 1,7-bisphosphate phosphatase